MNDQTFNVKTYRESGLWFVEVTGGCLGIGMQLEQAECGIFVEPSSYRVTSFSSRRVARERLRDYIVKHPWFKVRGGLH